VIIDSSAIVAMLKLEPEAATFLDAIISEANAVMSAGSYVETGIVIDGMRNPALSGNLDQLLQELEIDIEPVTVSQARIARQAYRDFGKGSGPPARLNYGDCFAYALAIERGKPLLFKGDDFAHAGVERAL